MKKTILSLLLALVAGVTAATCTSSLRAQTSNWDFNYSGSIVQWTAPQTGSYQITAYGAQGGGNCGGSGAIMSGTFQINQGDVLNILVGGQGAFGGQLLQYMNGGEFSPSGGGGSFVVGPNNNTTPLVAAGGGGGAGGPDTGASDASTGTSGHNATGTDKSNQEGAGGTDGNGGNIGSDSSYMGGGGGGGFSGNGGTHVQNAQGGFAYLNGGAGGAGVTGLGVAGGFGGGGGGGANGTTKYYQSGPGGGGGYSGGGGAGAINSAKGQSFSAGGGGSYLASLATDISMSVGNTGYGLVTIDLVSSAATPTLTFAQPSYTFDYFPNSQFPLRAFSSSPGAITFVSGNPSKLTIIGDKATIKGAGQTTITATVAAAPGYDGYADSVQVTVNKSTLPLGIVCPSSIAYSKGKSFTLKTTALSADGIVTYTSSDTSVISINGNKATALKKGIATITASVAATANYFDAMATRTVTVK